LLTVIEAARQIKAGLSLENVIIKTKEAIGQIQMLGVFSTMKYLARSGRVNRSVARAADFLSVMPLLTFRQGEITRAGFVRTLNKGMEKLVAFVKNKPIKELIIVHSLIPEKARQLAEQLGQFIPSEKIMITQLGAALGVHGGPGVLLVALRLDN
jgi:DegV family protein with EDD domain